MYDVKRLERIDEFFKKLSIEEFEKKLEIAGINEIESSSNAGMELSLFSTYAVTQDKKLLYIRKKDKINDGENSYDLFSRDYAKAV